MANPQIEVVKALYGGPTKVAVDVTVKVQEILDNQFEMNPDLDTLSTVISSGTQNEPGGTLNIPDPDPGESKSFVISYLLIQGLRNNLLYRAIQDKQTLNIAIKPVNKFVVEKALYGYGKFTVDVTRNMQALLADPVNSTSLTNIGDDNFFKAIKIEDPDPNHIKTLNISYKKTEWGFVINQCVQDGQALDLSIYSNNINLLGVYYDAPGVFLLIDGTLRCIPDVPTFNNLCGTVIETTSYNQFKTNESPFYVNYKHPIMDYAQLVKFGEGANEAVYLTDTMPEDLSKVWLRRVADQDQMSVYGFQYSLAQDWETFRNKTWWTPEPRFGPPLIPDNQLRRY